MYATLQNHLSENFIETEATARILSLAIGTQKNCILFGEAGHAKSAMVQSAIEGLGMAEDCFVQSFGEGMDEARLFGGPDFAALDEEKVLQYHPTRSFLNYKVAVFEEIFDAPPIVLLALKDTLTARELRNGAQRFKMRTQCIIALTNRPPSEISEMGPAAHALIERFPLQLEVKWEVYDQAAYSRLFEKVHAGAPKSIRDTLAEMIGKIHEEGGFISPRSAVHALETILYQSKQESETDAFQALRFVPGFENSLEELNEVLKQSEARRAAIDTLDAIDLEIEILQEDINTAETPIPCLQAVKQLQRIEDQLSELRVPDPCMERRDNTRATVSTLKNDAQAKALDLTRV